MNPDLRSELLKIRHTRSLLGLLVAGVAYAAISMVPPALQSPEEKAGWTGEVVVAAIRGPMWLLAVVALLFGIAASAGEVRHRTLSTTVLLTPRRSALFAAKVMAVALAALGTAAAAALVSAVGAVALLRSADVPVAVWSADVWATAAAGMALVTLYAVAGVGIGFAARNDIIAVTAALVWVTVVEGVLPIVLQKPWLGEWLPGGLANRLILIASDAPQTVSVAAAVAVLTAVVVGMAAAGWAGLRWRDVPA